MVFYNLQFNFVALYCFYYNSNVYNLINTEKYEEWKDLELSFNPKDMLG